jgi:hypothetical protein
VFEKKVNLLRDRDWILHMQVVATRESFYCDVLQYLDPPRRGGMFNQDAVARD